MHCWLHSSSEPLLGAPAVPVPRLLAAAAAGVPAIADGPCILDGRHLDCWNGGFWDEPSAAAPLRIRLP